MRLRVELLLFVEAAGCIGEEALDKLVFAEAGGNGSRLNSQADLLRSPVPSKAYDTGIDDAHDVKLVQQTTHASLR